MSKIHNSASGAFAPLRQKVFGILWVATVVGNTGTFVRDVVSSWLVTDLSSAPAAVAMIQAASTLPIFLLAIPAGVLADILDRRKFLLVIQLILASASICLLAFSASGMHSITSLVAFTFVGGIGAALMAPTWQAIVPELVDLKDVRNAIALNSLGINISRAIGPAVGGAALAYFGAAVTYGIDVITYVFVIAALIWWKRNPDANDELPEHFVGAFRAGLRYARASRELHVVLLRAAVFFAFSSAVWALLPLVARTLLQGNAGFYGILLGAVGAGAILGALLMPHLRARLDADGLMLIAAVLSSAVMAALTLVPLQWAAILVLLVMGSAWITALTTLNGAAQMVLPNWVRGRALALYLTVFNGAMTAGSLVWGAVAEFAGIERTLLIAAGGVLLVGIVFYRLKIPNGSSDLLPSNHWPEPLTSQPVEHDRGPVLVTVEYRIDLASRKDFLAALKRLSNERRRDGAYAWGATEDVSDPKIILEWFMVESWAEHLRQHRRVSHAAADIQLEALGFHRGEAGPLVRHFLAVTNKGPLA
jgi:MFS family permease